MKLKNLILLGVLVSTGISNAQTDFRPGYIIKLTGDTIFGQIDYRGNLLMSGLCKFKGKDGGISEYSPKDINAFRFIDSKYYVAREINGITVFLEYLIKGKVNIFYMKEENGDHYYIDKKDVGLTEMPYAEGIKCVDEKQVFFKSKKHIGLLNYYMQDAPEFQSRIKSVKKPEHQNLIKLAKDYHNAVCEGEQCIIFETKLPPIKLSVTPFAGFIKYNGDNKFMNEYGGYVYVCAPRSSEKLFFKTGLAYHELTGNGEKLKIFKIPIQLQYIFRAYKLQPNISGGVNILSMKLDDYGAIDHPLSMSAGLNYLISENISLCMKFNSDFTSIAGLIMADDVKFDLISYSVIFGLKVDL